MATGQPIQYYMHSTEKLKKKDHVIIFATKNYAHDKKYPKLKWIDYDYKDLSIFWEGYRVHALHDCKVKEMENTITTVSKTIKKECSCLVLVFLGYGDHSLIRATDADIALQKLLDPLKECENLAGKPKIVILQTQVSPLVPDAGPPGPIPETTVVIPSEADWVYLWSRIPVSRFGPPQSPEVVAQQPEDEQGSFFIRSLLANFRRYAGQPITRVMRRTIADAEQRLNTVNEDYLKRVQELPFIINQLRKDLILPISS